MKLQLRLLYALTALSLTLAGCGLGSSSPGGGRKCERDEENEICVTLTLSEPVRLNEPLTATITVKSKTDLHDLYVWAYSSGRDAVQFEGPTEWHIDVKANEPAQVTTTLRFIAEGYMIVYGAARIRVLGPAIDGVSLHITPEGGTVNPPPGGE